MERTGEGGVGSLLGVQRGGSFLGVSCLRRLTVFRWGVVDACRDGVSGGPSLGPWRLTGGHGPEMKKRLDGDDISTSGCRGAFLEAETIMQNDEDMTFFFGPDSRQLPGHMACGILSGLSYEGHTRLPVVICDSTSTRKGLGNYHLLEVTEHPHQKCHY